MVLRTYKLTDGRTAVQMLNSGMTYLNAIREKATGHGVLVGRERIASDFVAITPLQSYGVSGGHFVGEAMVENITMGRGDPTETFVGLGSLPSIKGWDETEAFIAKARPAALARLGVALRRDNAPMTEADILFVSRMIPMWTTKPKFVRCSIARLMWSLRNAPYYQTLQPFWAIYAPSGPLADIMWDSKARDMTLRRHV